MSWYPLVAGFGTVIDSAPSMLSKRPLPKFSTVCCFLCGKVQVTCWKPANMYLLILKSNYVFFISRTINMFSLILKPNHVFLFFFFIPNLYQMQVKSDSPRCNAIIHSSYRLVSVFEHVIAMQYHTCDSFVNVKHGHVTFQLGQFHRMQNVGMLQTWNDRRRRIMI